MAEFSLSEPQELQELDKDGRERLNRLFYYCNTMLGGTGIPVHMEQEDYTISFISALSIYRSRSSRSINPTFGFLQLDVNQASYQLHERVDVVKRVIRTGGAFGGIGAIGNFEPFGAATANTILRGAAGGAGAVDLVSYELFAEYQETLSKVFAREINFYYRPENTTLIIHQIPRRAELVLLEMSILKTVTELLKDHFAQQWLQEYTHAVSMQILGEKYSLFATVAGPAGGTVIKGEQLKQAAAEKRARLEEELEVFGDSSDIVVPIRG